MSGLAHVCIFRPLSPRENRLSFGTEEHKRTTRSPATESWAPPGILYSHLRRLWILRESPAGRCRGHLTWLGLSGLKFRTENIPAVLQGIEKL